MNIVDSSAWLEYFADGPNAKHFASPIQKPAELIVPSITIYEVFKRICQQRNDEDALRAAALMVQGSVVSLDEEIAISAAKISVNLKTPMADSIVIATARRHGATIWSQDADFKNLSSTRYFEKQ